WQFWNAHPGRFPEQPSSVWARAEICGAALRGPVGEAVLASETQPVLVALGLRSGTAGLQPRRNAGASVALIPEPPAFLVAATRARKSRAGVLWLGLRAGLRISTPPDPDWVAAVRAASSRRLPLLHADPSGENAWRRAKERARRLRRRPS